MSANDVKLAGRRLVAFGFAACVQATFWGCGARPIPPPDSPVSPAAEAPPPVAIPDDCALIAEPGEPIATVAVSGPIDPSNAPRPSNESERLLFRQLYETLVGVDCKGRAIPGLAASWRLDTDGRTWIVTLREDARFSDGTAVIAADVRRSWSLDGMDDVLRSDASRLVESVVPVGDRTLAIALRTPRVDAPIALAHPDLAIAKSIADEPWPLGTRSAWRAPESSVPGAEASTDITVARANRPAIRFVIDPGDPRDLLDDGVDLLITRDRSALDYAATLPPFQAVPLAWQRTHVLLTPGRSRASPPLPEHARESLADDAVRGEARSARPPFWWQPAPECEVTPAPPRDASQPSPRIVYDASDGAARDLAERFVGLGTYQRATGLTGEALARARRSGTDAGYVMSLNSRPLDPCRDLQALMEVVPWLDPATIVPLVETRLQAIVRRGTSGVSAEWDGGLRIAGGGTIRDHR